jgi:hypothetical protein
MRISSIFVKVLWNNIMLASKSYNRNTHSYNDYISRRLKVDLPTKTKSVASDLNVKDLQTIQKYGFHQTVLKHDSISFICQGEIFEYRIPELLNKEFSLDFLQRPPRPPLLRGGGRDEPGPEPGPEPEPERETRGDVDTESDVESEEVESDGESEAEVETAKSGTNKEQLKVRFALFTVNTKIITPFVQYWTVPDKDGNYGFPETEVEISGDADQEDQQSQLFDACLREWIPMGAFPESDQNGGYKNLEITTEGLLTGGVYQGWLQSSKSESAPASILSQESVSDSKKEVVVFAYVSEDSYNQFTAKNAGTKGKWGILDELVYDRKLQSKFPVSQYVVDLFSDPLHQDMLYIYGPAVNPLERMLHGKESHSREMAPQELPYSLYLCVSQKTDDVLSPLPAVESFTPLNTFVSAPVVSTVQTEAESDNETGPGTGAKPEQEAEQAAAEKGAEIKGGADSEVVNMRTEFPETGYFYHFTKTPISTASETAQRYAVFMYSPDYNIHQQRKSELTHNGTSIRKGGVSLYARFQELFGNNLKPFFESPVSKTETSTENTFLPNLPETDTDVDEKAEPEVTGDAEIMGDEDKDSEAEKEKEVSEEIEPLVEKEQEKRGEIETEKRGDAGDEDNTYLPKISEVVPQPLLPVPNSEKTNTEKTEIANQESNIAKENPELTEEEMKQSVSPLLPESIEESRKKAKWENEKTKKMTILKKLENADIGEPEETSIRKENELSKAYKISPTILFEVEDMPIWCVRKRICFTEY